MSRRARACPRRRWSSRWSRSSSPRPASPTRRATPCVSAIAGHPISTKPHAGGMLLLGSNRKFPAVGDPDRAQRSRLGGKTAEQLAGTCPPATVDLGSWCLDTAPYPLTKARGRQEQLHLREQGLRSRRRLAAVGRRNCSARPNA